jgi:alcohol dehydrogenase class IV
MLPAILKYNYKHGNEKIKKLQQKIVDILWNEETVAEVLTRRGLRKESADAGDAIGAVVSELGMPRSLKDVGVGRDNLDALAVNCLKDPCLKANPVPLLEKEQVLEVLEMVVGN